LGRRPVDHHHNWSQSSLPIDVLRDAENFLKEAKTIEGGSSELEFAPVEYQKLKGNQRIVFIRVMAYFKALFMHLQDHINPKPDPLHINIDGSAGTGKSFLIGAICTSLNDIATEYGIPGSPVVRLAPTGVAAFGIRGWTIHYALGIGAKKWIGLTNSGKAHLQDRWKDIKLIILDEKSMVGCRTAGKIVSRLKDIFPEAADNQLAGMSLILFGDFCQLPPVGEAPLFTTANLKHDLSRIGNRLYHSIPESITLKQIFCQEGADREQTNFHDFLQHLRTNEVTLEDFNQLLVPRMWTNLPQHEREGFSTEIHLLPQNELVDTFNLHRLASLNKPVVRIKAINHGAGAAAASKDEAEGLDSEILLAEGASVMLTRNIWTDKGETYKYMVFPTRC